MKTQLFKKLIKMAVWVPSFAFAQDLAPGMNVSYTAPSNCSNQVTNISVDICNNDQTNAANGPFIVAMYLYDSGSGNHWSIGAISVNSVSAAACLPVTNWDIDMNQSPSLPSAGNYKLGVWVDTANDVSESDETNNAGLLSSSADIHVCAVSGIKKYDADKFISLFPVPASSDLFVKLLLDNEQDATIEIYDISGSLIQTVSREKLNAGNHLIRTDISQLENGIYFVKIKTGDKSFAKRFVVSK